MKKNNYGITLIALAVTIIIMLILAGVTISALTGNSGITTQAKHSKTKNELAAYKEQIDLFIADKKMENEEFDEESLFSGKNTLRYNTQNENETGTIKTICPQMKNDYLKRLEIKKGKAILDTKDVTEIEIARSLGINVNPYEISEDGELISSNGNLLLIDTNGTLELPDTVITIGEGAFANTASDGIVLRKVIIPYTVKEIKQNAFNGNNTIEEVEFQTKSGKGVTKIGDFLRRTSIDELPQLINILNGSMSIVGPRPIVQKEIDLYGDYANKLFSVVPGLTGYWQANGRSDTTYEERIKMDMYYIDNRGFWLDFKIIIKTFGSVLKGEGAV